MLAVAAFAALTYAVTQATGGGLIDISAEQSDLDTAKQESIQVNIDAALWRLKLINGCKDNEISYETPSGDNANPDAPADNSCHVYHPAGGGVPYIALGGGDEETSCLLDLEIGETCEGVIYAGVSGGNRIYTTPADTGVFTWDDGEDHRIPTSARSTSDGKLNTDTLVSISEGDNISAPFEAAIACRTLGTEWYLPSIDELNTLFDNQIDIGGFPATYYWSSTELSDRRVLDKNFSTGDENVNWNKQNTHNVRCVRRD